MRRSLGWISLVYLPHLLEEAMTGMHDDPIIVAAWAQLSGLEPRHATYLVFQFMLALLLATSLAWSHGPLLQRVVLTVLSLSLLAESHHLARAIASSTWNSGLATSLIMPFVGALVLHRTFHRRKNPSCSNTSSSPWASRAWSSGSPPSSPPT